MYRASWEVRGMPKQHVNPPRGSVTPIIFTEAGGVSVLTTVTSALKQAAEQML